jgi:hypothetical protein
MIRVKVIQLDRLLPQSYSASRVARQSTAAEAGQARRGWRGPRCHPSARLASLLVVFAGLLISSGKGPRSGRMYAGRGPLHELLIYSSA